MYELILKSLPYVSMGGSFAFFWGLIKAIRYWGALEEKLKRTDNIENNINSITKNISKIEGTMELIQKRIDGMDGVLQSYSPINLTEKGKEIAKNSRIEDFIAQKWEEIKNIVKSQCKNKNPYDIQEFLFDFAKDHLEKILGKDLVEELKIIAYKKGFDIYTIYRIGAVIIRDKYFKEENIDTGEVDKHDPNYNKD